MSEYTSPSPLSSLLLLVTELLRCRLEELFLVLLFFFLPACLPSPPLPSLPSSSLSLLSSMAPSRPNLWSTSSTGKYLRPSTTTQYWRDSKCRSSGVISFSMDMMMPVQRTSSVSSSLEHRTCNMQRTQRWQWLTGTLKLPSTFGFIRHQALAVGVKGGARQQQEEEGGKEEEEEEESTSLTSVFSIRATNMFNSMTGTSMLSAAMTHRIVRV